jgi:hypothetical protein
MWRNIEPVSKTFPLIACPASDEGNRTVAQTNGMWSAGSDVRADRIAEQPKVA